jgi:D-aminopeptidase
LVAKAAAPKGAAAFRFILLLTRMRRLQLFAMCASFLLLLPSVRLSAETPAPKNPRPRVRDLGLAVGILPPGPLNAITDVAGVRVGHTTVVRGENVRTGVTAVLPHSGNLFRDKVPGAVFVGNGFGKLMGSTQVDELGEIETPIILTSTLSVPRAADAVLDYTLSPPGNEDVRSVNALVAETNDGVLNDGRGRHIGREDVRRAIDSARDGAVVEGSVGAGTGTIAFGWKGGIGTSSRALPAALGGYTVGALVQTNYGGVLTIGGAPVGRELGKFYLSDILSAPSSPASKGAVPEPRADGSIIIVIATDAPVDARNLRRMASRAIWGLARTGASGSNGSGDYAIAFTTQRTASADARGDGSRQAPALLSNDAMSPLFLAVIEATEEAIYNSLFAAETMTGSGKTVEALPLDRTLEILRKYGAALKP